MRNPFLKYLFTCKSCGNETPCQLEAYSKGRLLKIHSRPFLDQRCHKCGYEANYHFDRFYAKTKIWPVILVWSITLAISVFAAYWRYHWWGGIYDDVDLGGIAFGFFAPLSVGSYVVVRMWRIGKNFNKAVRDIR